MRHETDWKICSFLIKRFHMLSDADCTHFWGLCPELFLFFFPFSFEAKFGLIRRHVYETTLQFPASLICDILFFVPE